MNQKCYFPLTKEEMDAQQQLLNQAFSPIKREHISSVDCWCKPYPTDDDELVWVHRDPDENAGNA